MCRLCEAYLEATLHWMSTCPYLATMAEIEGLKISVKSTKFQTEIISEHKISG